MNETAAASSTTTSAGCSPRRWASAVTPIDPTTISSSWIPSIPGASLRAGEP
jgi:hypothetical protein